MGQLKSQIKPFDISKWEVKEAWEEVRSHRGAPGVDGQSIDDFEKDLKGNLYKVWNRMSSGSYFPLPVRAVEIPKPHGGGTRMLGISAVADRVAQTVVARHLMRRVDPVFHPDSYGYRPGRSALDAVERCRERWWKRDWVVEFDIAKFFDSVPWDLLVKAVEAHTDAVWVNLYVRRWLAAPLVMPDGSLLERECGTPQGAPVSPVLANLFLHYAFDIWMAREFPGVWFERYADDAVLHCVTERQARHVLAALRDRLVEVGLQLHPDKTRIVYCKDTIRRGSYEHTSFTFLGYTFRPRKNRSRDGNQFHVRAGHQQAGPDPDRPRSAFLATALPHWHLLRRPRPQDQPRGRGLDQLLRPLPAVGAAALLDTYQRLPGALDPPEVQAARWQEEGPREACGDRQAVSAVLRSLAPHDRRLHGLMIRTTRAV